MDVQQVAKDIYEEYVLDCALASSPTGTQIKPALRSYIFDHFITKVFKHIEDYVVPQWKDFPDDPYNTSTIEQLQHNLQRYVARINSGVRGEEDSIRDLLKIAHVASVIWEKKTGLQEALMKEIKNGRIQSDV